MSSNEKKPLLGNDEQEHHQRLKSYQKWAFFITFGGYFMAHFSRKCYSTVKNQLEDDAGYSPLLLSAMDTVFMATYAAGNVINGKLGDTFDPTTILAIGLWGSGACLLLINIAIWFDFHGISAMLGNCVILVVYFLFGFFQATGGPVGTAVMGNWFCDKESTENRGTIFGFWTCHQYCGDITAQLCTSLVLGMGWPWWWALFVPSVANILWAFLTNTLVSDPAKMGIITPEVRIRKAKMEAKRKEMAEQGQTMAEDEGPQPITFTGAIQIPMVAQYALAFGFFKLINYVLFFWLPYFLSKHFDDVTANLIAALYSVGMMPGGIIVGRVSDLFGGRRAVVIAVFMLCLVVFLAMFAAKSAAMSPIVLLIMLGLMGILVGGPNNIITSAVAADLSSHPSVRGSNKSLGTVTGLINGSGSVVASIGLLAVGPLQENLGWGYVWVYLIACAVLGVLLLATRIYAEIIPSSNIEETIGVEEKITV